MLKIYIANLGKYNEGELVGKWIELPCFEEDLQELFVEIKVAHYYKELMKIIKNIKTIEQVKKLDKENLFTIEINGMSIDDFLKPDGNGYICCDNDIEWIRYENYGCLSYIYDRFNGSLIFDVWSNYCYCEFIENITMDKLTRKAYEEMKAKALNYFNY